MISSDGNRVKGEKASKRPASQNQENSEVSYYECEVDENKIRIF